MVNGFFDVENRLDYLTANGDILPTLKNLIPWEDFRSELEVIYDHERKSNAGRRPFDVVMMFKILILQSLYNLSDDEMECQIMDRLSFMRFLGLDLDSRVPGAVLLCTNWIMQSRAEQSRAEQSRAEQKYSPLSHCTQAGCLRWNRQEHCNSHCSLNLSQPFRSRSYLHASVIWKRIVYYTFGVVFMLTLYSHAQNIAKQVDLPTAVPVVTAEEAEKLNEDAKAYALAENEKREPFWRDYENLNLKTVSFQGTIRAVSEIPDPETNDYPNCLYSTFVELDSILSDTPLSDEVSYEVILNIPIMKDKEIKKDNIFQPGDMIICDCAEYDTMPQSIQEIQLSDDIQSFEHQQYYALTVNRVSDFIPTGKKDFAKREITILPIQSLPKDENSARLRRKRIQEEIQHIEDELKKHGGTFSAWKKEYKQIDNKYRELCSSGYRGWINNSFFSAIGSESTYRTKEYIDWILPYKKYLEQNNIDLIILRYPSRSDFAARVLASDDFQENPAWIEHYYECLKNDIEIVDPMPMMWKNRFNYPLFYFYGHDSDIHPFEGELKVAAEAISQVLKERYEYKQDESFSLKKRTINNRQYFYPAGHPRFASNLPVEFDGLFCQDKPISYLSANSGSPFLFLSSSVFGYREMQALGASVPHYTSFFLQTIVDWKYQSGVVNSMIRNLVSSPGLLNNRRAVVMVGRYNSWNSGPKIPKYFFENNDKITFDRKYDFHSPDISVTNDSCSLFVTDDGGLDVSKDLSNKNTLSVKIDVRLPSLSNHSYKTYMIRVNLKEKKAKIMIELYSEAEKIDFAQLSNISLDKTDLCADLFVPITNNLSSIQIVLSSNQKYSIKDIEIWYY